MKKRLLLKLGLVALLGAGLFYGWLWWMEPKTGICRYTANRIQEGMTESEVLSIIGSPPMMESTEAFGPIGTSTVYYERWWHSDSATIIVSLNKDKCVSNVSCHSDNIINTIRRWLHLN